MLTRAAPGGATYFMLVGDAGDGHGGAARGVHERSRDNGASDVTNVQVPASVRGDLRLDGHGSLPVGCAAVSSVRAAAKQADQRI